MTITVTAGNAKVTNSQHTIQEVATALNIPVVNYKNGREKHINFGGNNIQVETNGTLVHEKGYHITFTGGARRALILETTGKYVLGSANLINNKPVYVDDCSLNLLMNTGTPYHWSNSGIQVSIGGTFEQYGGTLSTNASLRFQDDCVIKLRNAKWLIDSDTNFVTIYLQTENKDIDGLLLDNIKSSSVAYMALRKGGGIFNKYTPRGIQVAAGQIDRADTGVIDIDDYAGGGFVTADVLMRTYSANTAYVFNRPLIGHDLIVKGQGGGQSQGYVKTTIDYSPKFLDSETKNGIVEAKYYLTDTDNNKRSTESVQLPNDVTYEATSDANGSCAVKNIATSIFHIDGNTSTTDYIKDIRLPVSGSVFKYGYNISSITLSDDKVGTDKNGVFLVKDNEITLSQTSTKALTAVTTAEEFICVVENYIAENFTGQTKKYFKKTGNLIEALGDYNVTFSATTAAICAYDSTSKTFTIKATDFKDNIKTTATVSVENSAEVTGSISDKKGDSNLHVTVPSGYDHDIDLHLTKADAEAQTNLVATGESFRYQSQAMGGRNVWFRMTKEDGSYIIQSHVAPLGAGSYEISLVVTNENQALGEIRDTVRVLENKIDEARDHALAANTQTKQRGA